MKELHTLRDTAQDMLGGLTAGEELRRRVLLQAEAPKQSETRHRPRWWSYAPACAAIALIIGISALTMNRMNLAGEQQPTGNPIDMISAGQPTLLPGGVLVADVPEDSLVITDGEQPPVEPIIDVPEDVQEQLGGDQNADDPENTETFTQSGEEIDNGQDFTEPNPDEAYYDEPNPAEESFIEPDPDEAYYDDPDPAEENFIEPAPTEESFVESVPLESVTTEQDLTGQPESQEPQGDLPGYRNLFVQWDGANIPLIGMQYRAYQQTQVGVPQNLVGNPLGSIALYTTEPALAEQDAWSSFLSNTVSEGTMVYMVQGISAETAIAAEVNGGYVLFQRASFAGYGTGGQSLEQVLDVRGNVSALTLSGVGSLNDSGKANAMMSLLLDNASFYADNSFSGRQSLEIVLSNGLTLQLQIADGVFTACGAWTCAEFFTQFQSMLAQ